MSRDTDTDSVTTAGEVQRDFVADFNCYVCYELLHEPVVAPCGHDFCKLCFEQWTEAKRDAPCPLCKARLPRRLSVCVRLQDIIRKLFPQKSARRKEEVEAQQREKRLKQKRHQSEMPAVRLAQRPRTTAPEEEIVEDVQREILDWVRLPEEQQTAMDFDPHPPGPSTPPPFISQPASTAAPTERQDTSMQQGFSPVQPGFTGGYQQQGMEQGPQLAANPFWTQQPIFTPGRAETASPHSRRFRSRRYTNHNRMRHVPTRFSPEFTMPSPTISADPDLMDM